MPPLPVRTVLWRTQAPFLVTLAVALVAGAVTEAGPTWPYVAAGVAAACATAATGLLVSRLGEGVLIGGAVVHMVVVAGVDYASWPTTPSMVGLMMLPALHLSYGFRARRGPYLLAVGVPPILTALALGSSRAVAATWASAAVQILALVAVATVVYLSARHAWLQRVQLQQALLEARAAVNTAQVVADAIETGVTYYDTAGRVEVRNKAMTGFAQRAGYDAETVSAQHIYQSDQVTPVDLGEQPMERMLRGDMVDHDLFYLGPPGDQRAVTFTTTKLDGLAGPAGWVLAAHDVTDLVNAITTREEMILTFTHELRTPLTSIIGFAEMLQDTLDLEELGIARPVEVIHRNATHLSTLVQMLLQAGIEAQAEPHFAPTDVGDIVRESVASFQPKAAGRGITLEAGTPIGDTRAEVDHLRIRQVLDNLVSNALKYPPAGTTTRVLVEGTPDHVRVRVVDQGPGIDPQDLPQLFQRGFRSVTARRTATQGMGLGLAIARDIARAHSGEVTMVNNPDGGTTFTLELPRHPNVQTADAAAGDQATYSSALT
ncbi:hypothetical protein GCM10025875_37480 [Litorihabitans aurantiacus]|uniref:histidine kinase n=1 Tax=Litorihabitans aurantiacus TaxID=1930061 RepID=A0AA37XIF9_9MICO|nr:hypothetical protein GCM10025875_36740 [Litorihabitans aurantiacus]GMA33693.1 hypothetical protein GCM10025875_36850 [Litorihabitans aurantiacus]GMA33756.1 hypothetical protein GCM10025875_37480 [Litorihabitans aurantiacus]